MIARGGKGGSATSISGPRPTARRASAPRANRRELELKLELRVLADVGLPRPAQCRQEHPHPRHFRRPPQGADYPSPPCTPTSGRPVDANKSFVVADVPGLIEGRRRRRRPRHPLSEAPAAHPPLLHIVDIAPWTPTPTRSTTPSPSSANSPNTTPAWPPSPAGWSSTNSTSFPRTSGKSASRISSRPTRRPPNLRRPPFPHRRHQWRRHQAPHLRRALNSWRGSRRRRFLPMNRQRPTIIRKSTIKHEPPASPPPAASSSRSAPPSSPTTAPASTSPPSTTGPARSPTCAARARKSSSSLRAPSPAACSAWAGSNAPLGA